MNIKPLMEMARNSTLKGSYSNTQGVRIITANVHLGAMIFVFRSNLTGVTHVEFQLLNKEKGQSKVSRFYTLFRKC